MISEGSDPQLPAIMKADNPEDPSGKSTFRRNRPGTALKVWTWIPPTHILLMLCCRTSINGLIWRWKRWIQRWQCSRYSFPSFPLFAFCWLWSGFAVCPADYPTQSFRRRRNFEYATKPGWRGVEVRASEVGIFIRSGNCRFSHNISWGRFQTFVFAGSFVWNSIIWQSISRLVRSTGTKPCYVVMVQWFTFLPPSGKNSASTNIYLWRVRRVGSSNLVRSHIVRIWIRSWHIFEDKTENIHHGFVLLGDLPLLVAHRTQFLYYILLLQVCIRIFALWEWPSWRRMWCSGCVAEK